MLEFIRKHKIIAQIILLIFIVPSFIFVGVEGYQRMGSADSVAKVDGVHISQQEWEHAQRQQADELRQRSGAQFDSKWIESADFKWAVLENMIAERVIAYKIKRDRLTVDEQIVLQKIREIPGLMGPDRKIDEKRYKEALAAQGMTPEMHFAMVHKNLIQQQIGAPLQFSTLVPVTVTNRIASLLEQEREVQKISFKAIDYRTQVKANDNDIEKFHKEHTAQFTIAEHVDIEIAVLDMASVAATIKVSDADIKSYYEQNAGRFTKPEERRIRHILIAVKKDAAENERKAAKEKAEGILAQIKKNPASFAHLAKEHSQDPGSAQNGGDLGFFTKGKMVKPFEETAFAMKKGETSELVQTDYGYHILNLIDIKPAIVKSLAEMKNQILQEVKGQLVNKKYIESAELFSNMVYEQPQSLQPVAEKFGLKIHKLQNVTREPNPAIKHPLMHNQKFLQAIFSEDAIKNKHNTEAIELQPQVLISARVNKHYPAKVRELDEVKKFIHVQVIMNKARAMAEKASSVQMEKLQTGEDIKGFSGATIISRQKINASGQFEQMAVMQANTEKLPAYVLVNNAQGYDIYRINKVMQSKKTAGPYLKI